MKNEKIEKFTDLQIKVIEETFDKYYSNVRRAASFINLAKESLINVHGEFNSKITLDEISDILQSSKEFLEPIQTLMGELSVNGDYLLWEDNLNNINFKFEGLEK